MAENHKQGAASRGRRRAGLGQHEQARMERANSGLGHCRIWPRSSSAARLGRAVGDPWLQVARRQIGQSETEARRLTRRIMMVRLDAPRNRWLFGG